MSNTTQDSEFTNALLSALEVESDAPLRVRGAPGARPPYALRELPLPPGNQPLARPTAAEGSKPRAQSAPPASLAAQPLPESETRSCPACGADNIASARHCTSCGHDMQAETSSGTPAAKTRVPATREVTFVSIHEDGSDGQRLSFEHTETVIGRAGDIRFPTDSFLSPKHARVTMEGDRVYVEDLYSLNGTYVKLRSEQRLTPGDTFLMGRQVLRFERFESDITPKARASDGTRYMGSPPPGGRYKLLQIGIAGVLQNVYCMPEAGAVIGREKGDIIFVRDKFMSAKHAQIFPREDGHYYLADLKSSNGTWLKIWERKEIAAGDFVFLGQQLFRVEIA